LWSLRHVSIVWREYWINNLRAWDHAQSWLANLLLWILSVRRSLLVCLWKAVVSLGYWNLPEETAKSITPDGWFKSGDAGYVDAEGYVYIHDRVKDMIVSGGENVYPAEVENVLMGHPAIADVAVIGVPHEKWGETAKAVVVKKPGAEVTEQEIIDYARERLARFKCPTTVDWADVLPRNPSGKILKKDLRAPFWEGRSRNVN